MKDEAFSIDALKKVLDYNPDTGVFTWKVRPHSKSKQSAGDVAGRPVVNKSGTYWYICYGGRQFTAAKAAWAFIHGEWPNRILRFIDGNSMNTAISNLRMDMSFAVMPTNKTLPPHRRVTEEQTLKHRIKYHYGLELDQFKQMLSEQNGTCAICNQPERAMVNGKVKPLSVDHCHATGAVRELLCSHCNHALGHMCDSPDLLEKAAAYLRKHKQLSEAPLPDNVVKLKGGR